jgi:hypothetical protein
MPRVTTRTDIQAMPEYEQFAAYHNLPYWFVENAEPDTEDDLWHLRERIRMAARPSDKRVFTFLFEQYPNLAEEMERRYFAHVANDGRNVAFTPNSEYGRSDRQLVMKLGRMLARYFGDEYSNEQIKAVVSLWNYNVMPPELQFAETREQIAWVYDNGPSSCMGCKTFATDGHPCEAYAGPDTKVAYLLSADRTRAVARAVVRTDQGEAPQYIRIYGDNPRMVRAFQAAGIRQSPNGLCGARLLRLPARGQHESPVIIKAPFLDGGYNGAMIHPDDPSLLLVVHETSVGKEFLLKQTSGEGRHKHAKQCFHCSTWNHAQDDMYPVSPRQFVCRNCIINFPVEEMDLVEVNTEEGSVALRLRSDNFLEYVSGEHTLYFESASSLDLHNLYLVDGVVVDEHDDRVVRCAASGCLRLKSRCLKVGDEYFSEMSDVMGSKYPQFTLGRLLDSPEDSDDLCLGHIYNDLIAQYGTPLTRAEIQANTHPNIHKGLITLLIETSRRRFKFNPYALPRRLRA